MRGFETDGEDQQEELVADMRSSNFTKILKQQLQCLLGNENDLLQLWKKSTRSPTESTRTKVTHLDPWIRDQEKQQSWSQARWREHHIILDDRIVLEKPQGHEFRFASNWILTANSEGGTQLPLKSRPDFAQANRECKRLHDEHLTRT